MSKYIIDLRPDCKVVQQICAIDKGINIGSRSIGLLDELTDDYVKENFKDLLEGEYQRGFEDGVTKRTDGDACAGCEYKGKTGEHLPCDYCMNNFKNQWTAKDDEIEVGDEVIYNGTTKCLVVRPETDERYAVLIDGNGHHHSADHRECKKTGRHFDIASILEAMKHD